MKEFMLLIHNLADHQSTWTEVQQSAGRACRNQGKATCVVWTTDLPASANPRTAFSLND